MNMQRPTPNGIQSAAYNSMRQGAGFDPEVADDLGFTTPENAERQMASGREAGRLLSQAEVTAADEVRGWKPGDDYKNGFNKESWANLSEPQQEINRRGLAEVKRVLGHKTKKTGDK